MVGQLNWEANISRPGMSFSTFVLSTLQFRPTVADLVKANKALKERKSENVLIEFRSLNFDRAKLVVFCETCYGDLRESGPQDRLIIFLIGL